MTRRESFVTVMAMLFAAFDKPLTDLAVEAYWLVLSDFSDDQLRHALKKALEVSAFMPAPAVLRQYAKEHRTSVNLLAAPDQQPTAATFNYPTPEQQLEIRALVRKLAESKALEP